VRQVLIPLWNAWYFFSLYANAFGGAEGGGYAAHVPPPTSTDLLDRYLLAKLRQFVEERCSGAVGQLRHRGCLRLHAQLHSTS
jgi:isoleucyl-tRNA synthetase